jgi:hypothetical protein
MPPVGKRLNTALNGIGEVLHDFDDIHVCAAVEIQMGFGHFLYRVGGGVMEPEAGGRLIGDFASENCLHPFTFRQGASILSL